MKRAPAFIMKGFSPFLTNFSRKPRCPPGLWIALCSPSARAPSRGSALRTSAAQALAFAADAPVLCVSSLEALALTHQPALAAAGLDAVEVLVDARMGELYRATFALRDGGLAYGEEDQITTVEALGERPPLPSQWGLIGDGQSLPALALRGAEAVFGSVATSFGPEPCSLW